MVDGRSGWRAGSGGGQRRYRTCEAGGEECRRRRGTCVAGGEKRRRSCLTTWWRQWRELLTVDSEGATASESLADERNARVRTWGIRRLEYDLLVTVRIRRKFFVKWQTWAQSGRRESNSYSLRPYFLSQIRMYPALKIRIDKFVFAKNNMGRRKYNFLCVYCSSALQQHLFHLFWSGISCWLNHFMHSTKTTHVIECDGGESVRSEPWCYVLMWVLTWKRV
jgi:hypothetical protein